jgi:hypothetical protein
MMSVARNSAMIFVRVAPRCNELIKLSIEIRRRIRALFRSPRLAPVKQDIRRPSSSLNALARAATATSNICNKVDLLTPYDCQTALGMIKPPYGPP